MCAAVMMSEIGGVFPTGFVATQHTVVGCWPDDVRRVSSAVVDGDC
jgi:hypothetical protein